MISAFTKIRIAPFFKTGRLFQEFTGYIRRLNFFFFFFFFFALITDVSNSRQVIKPPQETFDYSADRPKQLSLLLFLIVFVFRVWFVFRCAILCFYPWIYSRYIW